MEMTRTERLEAIRKRNRDTAIYDASGAHRNLKDHSDVAWLLAEVERLDECVRILADGLNGAEMATRGSLGVDTTQLRWMVERARDRGRQALIDAGCEVKT